MLQCLIRVVNTEYISLLLSTTFAQVQMTTTLVQVMSPAERVGGAARGATPAVVDDGQDNTIDHQLEESRQCPPWWHWTRHSPCLVTRLSGCAGWNPRSPDKSTESGRTLRSRAFLIWLWERGRVSTSRLWSIPHLPSNHIMSRQPPTLVPDDQFLWGI